MRRRRMHPNTTIIGPSSAHQRYAIEMAFRWHAHVDPTLNAGLVARGSGQVLLRNPIFCDFSGGEGGIRTPCPPSGSADAHHPCINKCFDSSVGFIQTWQFLKATASIHYAYICCCFFVVDMGLLLFFSSIYIYTCICIGLYTWAAFPGL